MELNCAALPHELVEAELFGYEPGAFTGAKGRHHGLLEQADGGTLFLDEIGELELATQAKLLKAIEDKRFRRLGGEKEIQVDIQIIAASNEDLQQMIRQGHFREDLYHLPGQTPPVDEDSTIRLPLDGSLSLEEMEKRIIQTALERTANNVTAAARLLNTTRETLRYRIRKYHLPGLP